MTDPLSSQQNESQAPNEREEQIRTARLFLLRKEFPNYSLGKLPAPAQLAHFDSYSRELLRWVSDTNYEIHDLGVPNELLWYLLLQEVFDDKYEVIPAPIADDFVGHRGYNSVDFVVFDARLNEMVCAVCVSINPDYTSSSVYNPIYRLIYPIVHLSTAGSLCKPNFIYNFLARFRTKLSLDWLEDNYKQKAITKIKVKFTDIVDVQ